MDDNDFRISVLLSVHRALLGEITPEMRKIEVEISRQLIVIRVFTDGAASEQVKDDFGGSVVTQIHADFPPPNRDNPRVELEFVRIDAPERIPVRGHLVFARAEAGRYGNPPD